MRKILLILLLFILIPNIASAKTLIAPHAVVNEVWSFGIAIVNTSDTDDIIRYEVWEDKELILNQSLNIDKHSRWKLNGNDLGYGTYTIIIRNCSDETFGIFIRIWNQQPVGEEPMNELPYNPDLQSYDYRQQIYWYPIANNIYFYTMAGKCIYMGKYHWFRFRDVLYEIYNRYNGNNDPRPSLGDASAIT